MVPDTLARYTHIERACVLSQRACCSGLGIGRLSCATICLADSSLCRPYVPEPVIGADLSLALRVLKLSLRVQSSPCLPGVPLLVQLLYSLPVAGWWLEFALQAWILVLGGRKFVQSWLARPGLLGGKLCGSWHGGWGSQDRRLPLGKGACL